MSRHGGKGVIKLGPYASVVPGMFKSPENPAGHTEQDCRDIVAGIEADAPAFFRHTFLPPFYGKGLKSTLGVSHSASDDVVEAAGRLRDDGRHAGADRDAARIHP